MKQAVEEQLKMADSPRYAGDVGSAALLAPVWVGGLPVVAGERFSFGLAVGFSLLLHAVLLSLHFSFPDASNTLRERALDIILVNSRSAQRPTVPQALAQAHLDGGGDTELDKIAASPLPPAREEQRGAEVELAQKQVQDLETRQQKLLAANHSKTKASAPPKEEKSEAPPEPAPSPSGLDLANSALEMIKLEGQIARQTEEYNKRPRLKTIAPRTAAAAEAAYLFDWARKVERIGTLNFPEQAKGKVYGVVMVWVELRPDGTIYKFEIRKSSGKKILDDAARRIVHMGEPYGALTKAVLGNNELLGFARTLLFTNQDVLETSASP